MVIVHTHGPKPEMSICVVDYLARHVRNRLRWQPEKILKLRDKIVKECRIEAVPWMNDILQIIAAGFKVRCVIFQRAYCFDILSNTWPAALLAFGLRILHIQFTYQQHIPTTAGRWRGAVPHSAG